jgi:hypothetical protein
MLRGRTTDDGVAAFFQLASVTSFWFIRISSPPALAATFGSWRVGRSALLDYNISPRIRDDFRQPPGSAWKQSSNLLGKFFQPAADERGGVRLGAERRKARIDGGLRLRTAIAEVAEGRDRVAGG